MKQKNTQKLNLSLSEQTSVRIGHVRVCVCLSVIVMCVCVCHCAEFCTYTTQHRTVVIITQTVITAEMLSVGGGEGRAGVQRTLTKPTLMIYRKP